MNEPHSVTAAEQALHDCSHLAVLALRNAANGAPVECGRVLHQIEVAAFPHEELSRRAYLLAAYIEAFALSQWRALHAQRYSAMPSTRVTASTTTNTRSRRASSL